MSSGGYAASSSGCVTRPKVRETGSTGYAGPTRHSLLIGRYVMATAEHREPCDSRGSCTVLGAPGGEIPPGDSTRAAVVARWMVRPVCPQLRKWRDHSQAITLGANGGPERALHPHRSVNKSFAQSDMRSEFYMRFDRSPIVPDTPVPTGILSGILRA